MRGENCLPCHEIKEKVGTSPRARGKHRARSPGSLLVRNIPACAGKTWVSLISPPVPSEHPRVRGENGGGYHAGQDTVGTSPRARGKLIFPARVQLPKRNIPACAGKTFTPDQLAILREEHPRVRGENPTPPGHQPVIGGTSPRARGKPRVPTQGKKYHRNIPACAGKTRQFLG